MEDNKASSAVSKLTEERERVRNQHIEEDTFPSWLGALPRLRILILRSNMFHGAVEGPIMNEDFPELWIIDLSNNGFTGKLPVGWSAMKIDHLDQVAYLKANITFLIQKREWDFSFDYTMTITTKFVKTNYQKILNVFIAVDLSRNKFKGGDSTFYSKLKGASVTQPFKQLPYWSYPTIFGATFTS
ncbi:hypothetical protein LguiA_026156 [Lonicera macranthoides]